MSPREESGRGTGKFSRPLTASRLRGERSEQAACLEVVRSEGNEATREGHEGVGVTRSTDEASEREPEGAGGGKG